MPVYHCSAVPQMTVHSAVNSAVYGSALAELKEVHRAPSLVLLALHLLKERQAGAESPWGVPSHSQA